MDSNEMSSKFFLAVLKKEEAHDYEDEENIDHANYPDALPPTQFLCHTAVPSANKDNNAEPPKFVYFKGRCPWTYLCQFALLAELDVFRKANGMYHQQLRKKVEEMMRRYFFCSTKGCPFKMMAFENEHQKWVVYARNEHNHLADNIVPVGKRKRGRPMVKRTRSKYRSKTINSQQQQQQNLERPRLVLKLRRSDGGFLPDRSATTSSSSDGGTKIGIKNSDLSLLPDRSATTSSSSDGGTKIVIKNSDLSLLPDRSATTSSSSDGGTKIGIKNSDLSLLPDRSATTSSSSDGGTKIRIKNSATPQEKLFKLAKCVQELEQIGKEWNLTLKAKDASFLFMPHPDSKAFKDGILFALTDRRTHIRFDEFCAVRLQKDKMQCWQKELGHATIMQLAWEQCARMFSTNAGTKAFGI